MRPPLLVKKNGITVIYLKDSLLQGVVNVTKIPEGQPAPRCLVAGCGGSLVGGR